MKHQHPDVKTHRRTASGTVHTSDTGMCVCVCVCVCVFFFTSEHFTAWFHLYPSGLGSLLRNLANSCGCS